jgi:hypothetical protein
VRAKKKAEMGRPPFYLQLLVLVETCTVQLQYLSATNSSLVVSLFAEQTVGGERSSDRH